MTSAPIELKELDLDGFLDTNFDEFQGFPWGSLSMPTGITDATNTVTSSIPVATTTTQLPVQAIVDFSFDTQQPPFLPSVPQQHRLLNEKGLAYTLPDLTSNAFNLQNGQSLFGGGSDDAAISGSQEPFKERPTSSGSGELGVHRGRSQLSLTERNKQAQRRHRQRQRERMETLESQVKRLNEEKQALVAEKAALAGQAAVLTQVLQMRDEQLQTMRAFGSKATTAQTPEDEEETLARKEIAISSGLANSLAEVLTLTVREDRRIHLRPEQVKAMKPQEVARMWAEYMAALKLQLSDLERRGDEPTSGIESRISELLQEVLVLLMRYALGDLYKMKQFVAGKKRQAQAPVGLQNSEMWRAAARNLGLSEAQKKALCQLRRLFLLKHESLVGPRREAMVELQHTLPNAASSHDMACQFLKAEEAMYRIHENLRMENQLIVDLIYTLFIKIASPLQAAKCLVQSFPWYPDSLCILTWIAAEAGDLQATEMLQKGKQPLERQPSEQGSAGDAPSPSHSP